MCAEGVSLGEAREGCAAGVLCRRGEEEAGEGADAGAGGEVGGAEEGHSGRLEDAIEMDWSVGRERRGEWVCGG